VDEDLYWLFCNLEKLVFLVKGNKVKAIKLEKFNKKKNRILSKLNFKAFTMLGEVGLGDRQCPACGKLEFPQKLDSYTICRFCGWEDETIDDLDAYSYPNYKSLNEYKKEYSELIFANPNYIWEKHFKPKKSQKNNQAKEPLWKNRMTDRDYEQLEKTVMGQIIASEPTIAEVLKTQFSSAKVKSRDIRCTGFFTEFEVDDTSRLIPNIEQPPGATAKFEGLKYGALFVLFIKDGLIDTLECCTFGEERWLERFEKYEFK
jgi:hypothetical protein